MLFLVFGPAVLGVLALVVGIRLLHTPKGLQRKTAGRSLLAVLCLLFALGVGACYGWMGLSSIFG